ncbi:Tat pathway signal protein [Longispora urticae]
MADEVGAPEFAAVSRSHVSHWVTGTVPSGRAPTILCESLSRRLGREITLADIGLGTEKDSSAPRPDWHADTLVALADLGRVDVDADRRRLMQGAAYSLASLAVPAPDWWEQMPEASACRHPVGGRGVGHGDVEAVRDMVSMFSTVDQRRGGGHAHTAVVGYLTRDVTAYLRGAFADEHVRRGMFSAASELAYLAGWMAFDNSEHAIAQHYFTNAVKLAAEADDAPLAGHVLRAMAHQAVDLGHPQHALHLAEASVDGRRYTDSSPRERALLKIVHARALAAAGRKSDAAVALLRAEDDLATATAGDEEPSRVFFFAEASLAHETACTLRDCGDLAGAASHFRRSVRTRKAAKFTRTHAVTLGYLGAVQARQGNLEEACGTWSASLDAMDGIRSGRTRQVAADIRSTLSPFRARGTRTVADLETRAADYLANNT